MPGEDRLRAFCRRSDVPPDEESASLLQQPAYVRSGIPPEAVLPAGVGRMRFSAAINR